MTLSTSDVQPAESGGAEFDSAFPELYARAYRVSFQLVGSRTDAEEIAQEALARAFVRWPAVARGRPDAWVVVVATNLAVDLGRRRARRLPSWSLRPGGGDLTAGVDERVALCRALAALPKRQREVVVLRYLADFKEAEVADMLGVSVGTVKQHASRGCAHLRVYLGDIDPEDEHV